jgi:hypothetical protein
MTDVEIDKAIANWHVLNKELRNFTEEEVKRAIHRELVGNRRKTILERLHSRYCAMRQKREMVELLEAIALPVFAMTVPNME